MGTKQSTNNRIFCRFSQLFSNNFLRTETVLLESPEYNAKRIFENRRGDQPFSAFYTK